CKGRPTPVLTRTLARRSSHRWAFAHRSGSSLPQPYRFSLTLFVPRLLLIVSRNVHETLLCPFGCHFHPLGDGFLKVLHLRFRDFLEHVEALVPQLLGLLAQLVRVFRLADAKRLFQRFHGALVLAVPRFLPLASEFRGGLGPFLVVLLDALVQGRL